MPAKKDKMALSTKKNIDAHWSSASPVTNGSINTLYKLLDDTNDLMDDPEFDMEELKESFEKAKSIFLKISDDEAHFRNYKQSLLKEEGMSSIMID